MMATTICPKCGKKLESDCKGCIRNSESTHYCKDNKKFTVKVKWNIAPDDEDEEREIKKWE
jgi:hypothetical protein